MFESNCNSVGNDIRKNLNVIVLFSFFLIPPILTGIPLVYTEAIFFLVNTDEFSNWKNSVGKDHYKIPTKKIRQ
jgi:hypothetical protein